MTTVFEHEEVEGLVLYTDGSSIPNTGHYGSGVHGYVYRSLKEGEKGTTINAMAVTSKGYKLKNTLVEEDIPVVLVGYYDVVQSNFMQGISNTAEVEALVTALNSSSDFKHRLKSIHAVSDSRYLVDTVNKDLAIWAESHWRDSHGNQIPGMVHWKSLQEELSDLPEDCVFTIAWVKGHDDDLGNTRADYLARIGTNRSIDSSPGVMVRKETPGKYMKAKCELHPLLSMRRVYFSTSPSNNSQGVYFQVGASGQNFVLGKRSSEASYSVVHLKDPDPVMESIQNHHYRVRGDVDSIVYLRTDRVKSADVYPWISEYGTDCLIRDSRTEGLNFLDKKPLTIETSPGELPLQAMDALSCLNDILNEVRLAEWENRALNPLYEMRDITHHFFQDIEKKVRKDIVKSKELLKDIKMGLRDIDIPVEHTTRSLSVKLMFSDDIPERNVLKRLEELNPTISLLMWKESDTVLRYATVVKVDDSLSIWSNYFASRVFLQPVV